MQEYCGLKRSSLQVSQKDKGIFELRQIGLCFRKPCAETLQFAEELKSVFMKECQINMAAAAPWPVKSKLLWLFLFVGL